MHVLCMHCAYDISYVCKLLICSTKVIMDFILPSYFFLACSFYLFVQGKTAMEGALLFMDPLGIGAKK